MGATEVDRIGRDVMERSREENECPLTLFLTLVSAMRDCRMTSFLPYQIFGLISHTSSSYPKQSRSSGITFQCAPLQPVIHWKSRRAFDKRNLTMADEGKVQSCPRNIGR